ncbi:hypothetical protein [Promicromonospora iranensis]|uniref:Uncharacterized protein n=1 Tax=Promicromonospora iranensis TaxID=1105144 RepID=A0ABU2CIF7_9MICO|nr:hypothetical protein [Promicromonospora iranensis]MDR7381104.1 hypothetical protein [Promicromonospora iranensis]
MTEFPSRAARTAGAAALAEDESGQDVTTAWSVAEGLAMLLTTDPVPCPR